MMYIYFSLAFLFKCVSRSRIILVGWGGGRKEQVGDYEWGRG